MIAGASLGALVYLLRRQILGIYTHDAVVIAAALPLLTWVAVFHLADATQAVAAFVLRAYRIVTVPLLINAVALWGVGLGGGFLLAFDGSGAVPEPLRGAPGFWAAATLGLTLTAVALVALLAHTFQRRKAALRTAAAA
jgi:MATE family multidrug resistance protein